MGFAMELTNADADGRIVVDLSAATLKFVSLNAAAHFAPVRPGLLATCSLSQAARLGVLHLVSPGLLQ